MLRPRNMTVTRRSVLAAAAGAALTAAPLALAACGSASSTPTAGTKKISGGKAVFMTSGDAERFQIRDNLMRLLLETTRVRGEWIHFSGADYNQKLIAMLASDTAPDLIYFAPNLFVQVVTENLLRNLTPLIKGQVRPLRLPEKGIAQYAGKRINMIPSRFPDARALLHVEMVRRAGLQMRRQLRLQPSTGMQTFLE